MSAAETFVTWPQLLEWCKAHGAINDRITLISLATRTMDPDDRNAEIRATVTIEGYAEDDKGHPFTITEGNRRRLATWTVSDQLVHWLP